MDNPKKMLKKILENALTGISQDTLSNKSLWQAFLDMHPVDISDFLSEINKETAQNLFKELPHEIRTEVFKELSNSMKVSVLASLTEQEQIAAFQTLSADELTDLFDYFSDEELKRYLNLLHKQVRDKVMSLMKFDPESAGGVMHTDVLTLIEDFTVEKSIQLLQRIKPSRDIHAQIFVTNRAHKLVGYINLEDLVLEKPAEYISSFMHKTEMVAQADQDQEEVAKKMIHYGLMTVPVVDKENHFLGVIPANTLVDVVVEEAGEDIQRIGAVMPLKYPYFETSFLRLLWARGYILVILLLTESFSSSILHAYEHTLSAFLLSFIPMLISTGGNTSSQTSAVVIQGMASGDVTFSNMSRFLRREFMMAAILACILGVTSFVRVYITGGSLLESVVISGALALIVLLAAMLGSGIPLLLKRLNIDPAFSAGPFLATIMDIVGILIFCFLIKTILF
jgi:magnesium transporter